MKNLVKIITAILFYSVVSLCIVFVNRHLFQGSFGYPVFISWVQQVVGVTIYCLLGLVGHLVPSLKTFPLVKPTFKQTTSLMPLACCSVGMIAFSNVCLKYVQVSTYQVARSLTLIFNLVLSFLILNQKASVRAIIGCLIVVLGFVVASSDGATLSLIGIVTGSCGSFFQALYNVLIKKFLAGVNSDTLLFYNLFNSSFLFIPIIFLAGEQNFINDLILDPSDPKFWPLWFSLIGSGFLGVLITFASFNCVQVTSPVTFNVVGYGKACVQSLGGIVVLNESYTPQSISGILLTLSGSAFYSYSKIMEGKDATAPKESGNDDESRQSLTQKESSDNKV